MCSRKDSSIESHLKAKVAEAVLADYRDCHVCLKGTSTCILDCFLTIGHRGMCYGSDVLLSWDYLLWQQNPDFFSCTVEGINCSTERCANIPVLTLLLWASL